MEWLWLPAMALGLAPAAWLGYVRDRDPMAWWMAGAFGVSFLADLASLMVTHPVVSQLYPVSQAALFLAVMLPQRPVVERAIAALLAVAAASILVRDGNGLDVALHVFAWLAVSGAAWLFARPKALRVGLAVGFGLGAVAWAGFVAHPGWPTWFAFQGTRVIAGAGFCMAVSRDA